MLFFLRWWRRNRVGKWAKKIHAESRQPVASAETPLPLIDTRAIYCVSGARSRSTSCKQAFNRMPKEENSCVRSLSRLHTYLHTQLSDIRSEGR